MRLAKINIIVSGLIGFFSLLGYIAPFPAVLLTAEQMNAVLLALLGAGVSIFCASICTYRYERKKLENALLETAERVLSSLDGLRECVIESVGGSRNSSIKLLLDYFEEKESKLSCLFHSPNNRTARDELIQAIEHCHVSQVESFLNDPHSSFNRFVERSRQCIDSAIESYLYFCSNNFEYFKRLFEIIEEIDYLCLSPRSLRRKRLLKEINDLASSYLDSLTPMIQQARLFKCGEIGYGEILPIILETEKNWSSPCSYENSFAKSRNIYVNNLYQAVSEFASMSSSPLKGHYPVTPWWEQDDDKL